MRRVALGLGLAALAIGWAVVWLLREPASPRAARPAALQAAPSGVPSIDGSPRARSVSSAADAVSGWVVDDEGGPVEHGALVFSCVTTGRPIRGATVMLGEGGVFSAPGCGAEVCAQLQHPTLIQSTPWLLSPGEEVELVARPMLRIEGRVLDDADAPIPAASVVAAPVDEDPTALPPFVSSATSTDAEGRFSFARVEMPPCDACGRVAGRCDDGAPDDRIYRGPVSIVARAPGFRVAHVEVDEGAEAIEIALTPAELITRGSVLGADGRPFARLHVLARSTTRGNDVHSAWSIGEGGFELPQLGEGPYALRFIVDGKEIATREAVMAGDTVDVRASEAAAGVRVALKVLEGGAPVPDATVRGGPFRGSTTGADGQVIVEGVLDGEYSIHVRGGGHRGEVALVVAGQDVAVDVPLQ
jgi:hypothetical protein